MTAPTVQERVAAGSAWLDEHEPGWWQRVDLDTLRMESCERCVLGQVYGDFYEVPLTVDMGGLLGFDLNDEETLSSDPCGGWDALEDAWRDLITARRDTTALSTLAGAS